MLQIIFIVTVTCGWLVLALLLMRRRSKQPYSGAVGNGSNMTRTMSSSASESSSSRSSGLRFSLPSVWVCRQLQWVSLIPARLIRGPSLPLALECRVLAIPIRPLQFASHRSCREALNVRVSWQRLLGARRRWINVYCCCARLCLRSRVVCAFATQPP